MPAGRMLGAVLTGGSSSRMGTDKALLAVDGTAMARRVADALVAGGATFVLCVGGNLGGLQSLGLVAVADAYPGAGPLGGMLTALHQAEARHAEVLVVAACDHPYLEGSLVRSLRRALDEAGARTGYAVAVDADGRRPLLLALRTAAAVPVVAAAFATGARSLQALYSGVVGVEVAGLEPRGLRDVDTPRDLDER